MPTPPAAPPVFLPPLKPPPRGCPPCSPPQSGPRFSKGHQTPGSWGPRSAGVDECLIPSPGPPAFPASALSSLPLKHPASLSLFPLGSKPGLPFTRCPPCAHVLQNTWAVPRARSPCGSSKRAGHPIGARGAVCEPLPPHPPHLSLAPLLCVIISQRACKWHVNSRARDPRAGSSAQFWLTRQNYCCCIADWLLTVAEPHPVAARGQPAEGCLGSLQPEAM